MAVTDTALQNEIQYHLIETANGGLSYSSGLYTPTEVQARLNYRADTFNKLTNITTSIITFNAVSGNKSQDISQILDNYIDIIAVYFTPDGGTTWYSIPHGSSSEGDTFLTDQSAITIPNLYTLDSAKQLSINFFPAPTFTGANGRIAIFYLPNIGELMPATVGVSFKIPDDFTPYIKYGTLADLFRKAGQTYDPQRAEICESLFELGVAVAEGWISTTSKNQ